MSLRRFLKERKDRTTLTYDEIARWVSEKTGSTYGYGRAGAWFTREGVPEGLIGPLCELLGVTREEALEAMNEDDLERYETFIVGGEEARRALFRAVASMSTEELRALIGVDPPTKDDEGKSGRPSQKKRRGAEARTRLRVTV